MSNPINPLSLYNTYSYHHVFVACDNTKTAEALAQSNNFLDFMRDRPERITRPGQETGPGTENTPQDPFAKYNPRTINNGRGKYSIIINGMTDAEFVIQSANWFTVTAASTSRENAFETMAIEGELSISEPRGIRFMNVMSHVADQLGSNPTGIIFMLKTFFFGNKSGTFEEDEGIVPITYVRPIFFALYDITGEFKVTGGEYILRWMGLNHGVSKQKHVMEATNGIAINIGSTSSGCESNTLWGGLCRLQKRIDDQYKEHVQTLKSKLARENIRLGGREVNYKIIAEEPYVTGRKDSNGNLIESTIRGNPAYIVDDFKDHNKDTGEDGEGGIIDFGESVSIEAAILKIVNRCTKVKDDLKDGDDRGRKYTPKVSTTVISDETSYNIVYKLHRALESRNDLIQQVLSRTSDSTSNQDEDIRRNLLTLDYFFTGRNTDIINFDIRMEMGLVFFQTLVTTDNLQTNAESSRGETAINNLAEGNAVNVTITNEGGTANPQIPPNAPPFLRPYTPIFFSTKFDPKENRNTNDPGKTAEFQALLNRHAALENLEAVVTIHGNPKLLNSTNKAPSEIASRLSAIETQANEGDSADDPERDVFPYWETAPALLKINIKMPSDDQSLDYSEPFWYEGFYYCYGIQHSFKDGEFTQALNIISLPQSSPTEKTQKDKDETDQGQQADEAETTRRTGSATETGAEPTTTPATTTTTTTTQTTQPEPSVIEQQTILRGNRPTPDQPSNSDSITAEQYLDRIFGCNN